MLTFVSKTPGQQDLACPSRPKIPALLPNSLAPLKKLPGVSPGQFHSNGHASNGMHSFI
jgi:hypothetical protein